MPTWKESLVCSARHNLLQCTLCSIISNFLSNLIGWSSFVSSELSLPSLSYTVWIGSSPIWTLAVQVMILKWCVMCSLQHIWWLLARIHHMDVLHRGQSCLAQGFSNNSLALDVSVPGWYWLVDSMHLLFSSLDKFLKYIHLPLSRPTSFGLGYLDSNASSNIWYSKLFELSWMDATTSNKQLTWSIMVTRCMINCTNTIVAKE